MTGFYRQRQRQPAALDRAALTDVARQFIAENAAFANRTSDPFGVDNPCPRNSGGHRFIASCGDVVCIHCLKVVWQ